MAPKRKRVKKDPDVIKTEPEYRRATGDEKDDDFDLTNEPKVNLERCWTTIGFTRYKRTKLRQPMPEAEDPFPFMNLPAEIRNMIYRYLVVSKSREKIRLNSSDAFTPGGIDIAIILTNKKIHHEASNILYDENKCLSTCHYMGFGVALRIDDPKTKNKMTSRSLRSGRAVDMVKHKGLIYEHALHRVRHFEFEVNLFDRSRMCNHITLRLAKNLYERVLQLSGFINERMKREDVQHGPDWKIVIKSTGKLGYQVTKKILAPIVSEELAKGVEDKKFSMVLEGKFPKGWDSELFCHFPEDHEGFSTSQAETVNYKKLDIDIETINDYFEYGDQIWW